MPATLELPHKTDGDCPHFCGVLGSKNWGLSPSPRAVLRGVLKCSRGDGVHLWKESERAELRAELDAAYFHLYNIPRPDAEYILSTFTNTCLHRASDRPSQQLISPPGTLVVLHISFVALGELGIVGHDAPLRL
jgi:hypothetical protein